VPWQQRFRSSELALIVDALSPITNDALRARPGTEAPERTDIHPYWHVADIDDYIAAYRELQQFLAGGVRQGLGFIFWLD
jgi:hypothetical protein